MEKQELTHWGIKGMKWGVRRYQNKDGSLTAAGKKRKRYDKWGDSKHQPSSTRSSVLAGAYMATGNKKIGEALDKSNSRDAERWERAKTEKAKYQAEKAKQQAAKAAKKAAKEASIHEDYKKAHNSKSVKNMSDAELRSRLNRLNMEKQYSQLSDTNVNKGKQYFDTTFKVATTVAAVTTTGLTIYNNADKIKKIVEPMIKK